MSTDFACPFHEVRMCPAECDSKVECAIDFPTAAPIALRVVDGNSQPPTHADTAPVRTAQVLRWRGITKLDLPTDQIIGAAQEAGLRCVVVLGYDADGAEYFASSIADGADVLWLLERLKQQLLTTGAEANEV